MILLFTSGINSVAADALSSLESSGEQIKITPKAEMTKETKAFTGVIDKIKSKPKARDTKGDNTFPNPRQKI